jgi:hypothetical protein
MVNETRNTKVRYGRYSSCLQYTNFFFPAEDEAAAARISAKNGLTLTISATPSATRNWQTNLSLPTSQSWKLLSTRPSNGSMPLKKDRKKSMKRNKRGSKGIAKYALPSSSGPYSYFPLFFYQILNLII